MKKTGGLYKYEFYDPEVEIKGLLLAKDDEDAKNKANALLYLTHPDEEETLPIVTHVLDMDKFETLVVTGSVETYYDDWD
ncbi:dihydrofolate reductase [Bacillus phage vB_BcgM]|nr:dihydrofolate reductase [Bacillus phage vB_BcgM]